MVTDTLPTVHPYRVDQRLDEHLLGLGVYEGRDAAFEDLGGLLLELRELLPSRAHGLLDTIEDNAHYALIDLAQDDTRYAEPRATLAATLAVTRALAGALVDRILVRDLERVNLEHEDACRECDEDERCATGELLTNRLYALYQANDALQYQILPALRSLAEEA